MIIDLIIYIKSLLDKQYKIIFLIDANKPLVSKSRVAKLFNDTVLNDLVALRYDIVNELKAHKRGSSRICFVFSSKFLNQYIKLCGIILFD